MADSGERHCSCGNLGCLETVASGAALVHAVGRQGLPMAKHRATSSPRSRDGDPTVNTMVRHAGGLLGGALSGVVNFFNPQAVVLGGALASLDVYVAAARGMLYERCLPLTTQALSIGASVAGPDAALVGLGSPHTPGGRRPSPLRSPP